MNAQIVKRRPLVWKVVMATVLILTGSVAAFGWFTDRRIESLEAKIAQIQIGIQAGSGEDSWQYEVIDGKVNANGSFVLSNTGDREIYMRVGVIPTWLDESEKPVLAEVNAVSVLTEMQMTPNEIKPVLHNANIRINNEQYNQKKAFIKLVAADMDSYTPIPAANVTEDNLTAMEITCLFTVKAETGIPDNAKFLRLSFVPEAIQATEDALAYVQSTADSGLNAPW